MLYQFSGYWIISKLNYRKKITFLRSFLIYADINKNLESKIAKKALSDSLCLRRFRHDFRKNKKNIYFIYTHKKEINFFCQDFVAFTPSFR